MRKKHITGQPVTSIPGPRKTQWHPPFCASMQLELKEYKSILEYLMEYALSTKPLLIDLLVIKKLRGIEIENEIGCRFRSHNVIEYKSPDEREYVESVLQLAMETNREIFGKVKGCEEMCQAFWELYAPEIEEERRASEMRGEKRGEKRGIEIGEVRGEKRGIEIGEVRGEKRGIEIGEKRGEKLGERRTLISQIIKKIQRGKDILSIADAIEEPVERIRPIYEAVLAAPGADVGQIYEKAYVK